MASWLSHRTLNVTWRALAASGNAGRTLPRESCLEEGILSERDCILLLFSENGNFLRHVSSNEMNFVGAKHIVAEMDC